MLISKRTSTLTPIEAMLQLAKPVPAYITEFDDRILVGGLFLNAKGEMIFSFFLGRRLPDGRLTQGPGFGGAHYKR